MWASVEHMRDNWVWNPSPVSRSSASSGYCSCGIRLSAHHFWYLQFPHLQVSLSASGWRFLSLLLLAQDSRNAEMNFLFLSKRERERERRVWNRICGSCCYRCQCGIYMIVSTATAQQVTALKQRWSVFKLPSELIYRPPNNPDCYSHLMIISVFIECFFLSSVCWIKAKMPPILIIHTLLMSDEKHQLKWFWLHVCLFLGCCKSFKNPIRRIQRCLVLFLTLQRFCLNKSFV